MNKTTKIIIGILVILIVIIGFYFLKNKNNKDNAIKIGVMEALSGDGAVYGNWAKNNFLLAEDKINSTGGISGRKIQLIFEDHKALAQEAVSAYQKLKLENVPIVFIGWSSPALAVAPLANKDKKILITHSATTPLYSTKDDFTFRTAINAKQLAQEEAKILYNKLDKKRVSVIYVNNDFGVGMKNAFVDDYKGLGGNILTAESFEQGARDFRDIITKVKSINPEAIFLVGQLTENGLFVRQTKELGFNAPIVSDVYSIESQEFLKQTGDASEGIIYVAPYFDKNKYPDYSNEYKKRHGEDPNYYAQAYDALMIIGEVLKKCPNEYDTECLKNELYKIKDYEGVSGIFTFDEYGDVQKPIIFKTIKNGQFVPYEE